MNINTQNPYTIFRNEVDGKKYFKIGLSKKKQDGTYERGYVPIQFKKDVDIPNQTKIYLRNAWWTFYNTEVSINGAEHKKTIPYIFCNDFVTLEDRIEETRTDFDAIDEKKDNSFKTKEIELTDDDLPF